MGVGRRRRRGVHSRRFARALGMVVLLLGGMFVVDAAVASDAAPPSYISRVWQQAQDAGFSERAVEGALHEAGFVAVDASNVPEWLAEVVDLETYEGVIADATFSLIGYSCVGDAGDVFKCMSDELCGKGWIACQSGYDNVGTFVKGAGECRWLMVECTETDGEVNIVLHIRRA